MRFRSLACCLSSMALILPASSEPAAGQPAEAKVAMTKDGRPIPPQLKAAVEKLKLPGLQINLEQWAVDVDSRVCLRDGLLELIACTKDSKEHESIIAVDAKPSHIHAALLLLGARAGNPASQQIVDRENGGRFVNIPPKGSPVDVLLVIKDDKGVEREHPIRDFIRHSENGNGPGDPAEGGKARQFPADPFVFAGSVLIPAEKGPGKYVCDESGDVISISTFGDELLCMSGVRGQENESLEWQADPTKLPQLGSQVILRLRPKLAARPSPAPAAPAK